MPPWKPTALMPHALQLVQDGLQRLAIFGEDQELAGESLQNFAYGLEFAPHGNGFGQGEKMRAIRSRALSPWARSCTILRRVEATAWGLLLSSRCRVMQGQTQMFVAVGVLEAAADVVGDIGVELPFGFAQAKMIDGGAAFGEADVDLAAAVADHDVVEQAAQGGRVLGPALVGAFQEVMAEGAHRAKLARRAGS